MSVQARVEDALLLWKQGRREGAFLVALLAVAATSRRRFPRQGDREGFERFLRSTHPVRMHVEFRNTLEPIEHILYKWVRCTLVHEAQLPYDIEFMPATGISGLSVRAGGAPDFVLKLSETWFDHLINVVINAPENREEKT